LSVTFEMRFSVLSVPHCRITNSTKLTHLLFLCATATINF